MGLQRSRAGATLLSVVGANTMRKLVSLRAGNMPAKAMWMPVTASARTFLLRLFARQFVLAIGIVRMVTKTLRVHNMQLRALICPKCLATNNVEPYTHGFVCQACGAERQTTIWGDPIENFSDTWLQAGLGHRAMIVAVMLLLSLPFVLIGAVVVTSSRATPPPPASAQPRPESSSLERCAERRLRPDPRP